ncbi:MAG: SGNH/GDSL hydrolase family protein [Candidatus Binatia bacterium]|nr:SGNH/GDSL hydrolase family protein [Candidatus Binatia bacterium]
MRTLNLLLLSVVLIAGYGGCADTASLPEILRGVDCVRTAEQDPLQPADSWDVLIEGYERADSQNPPEPGATVFIGSSSILFWATVADDMAPLPVLNRGFGGSVMTQATGYIDRIVLPYQPRAVVLYEGDNDIAFGLSADCVLEDYDAFVATVHEEQPDVPIYFLAIKPSIARAALWPVIERANALVRARTSTNPKLNYIDVATPIFDASGEIRGDLFVADGLHLNAAGYALWTSVVHPVLLGDLS